MATEAVLRFQAEQNDANRAILQLRNSMLDFNKSIAENRQRLASATGEQRKAIQAEIQAANVKKGLIGVQIQQHTLYRQEQALLQRVTRQREVAARAEETALRRVQRARDQAFAELSIYATQSLNVLSRLGGAIVSVGAQFETFEASIRTVAGSAEAGRERFEDLLRLTRELIGIPTDQLLRFAGQLDAVGLSADQTNAVLSGVVKSQGELGKVGAVNVRILTQLQQAISANKISGQDLLPIIREMPRFWEQASEAIGIQVRSLEQLRAASESVGGPAQALIRVFSSIAATSEGIPLNTFNAQMERLTDALTILAGQIAQQILPLLTEFARRGADLAEGITEADKATGGFWSRIAIGTGILAAAAAGFTVLVGIARGWKALAAAAGVQTGLFTRTMTGAGNAVDDVARSFANMSKGGGGNFGRVISGFQLLGSNVESAGRAITRFGPKLLKLGAILGGITTLGFGVVEFLRRLTDDVDDFEPENFEIPDSAQKSVEEFDARFSRVSKLFGLTQEQVRRAYKEIENVREANEKIDELTGRIAYVRSGILELQQLRADIEITTDPEEIEDLERQIEDLQKTFKDQDLSLTQEQVTVLQNQLTKLQEGVNTFANQAIKDISGVTTNTELLKFFEDTTKEVIEATDNADRLFKALENAFARGASASEIDYIEEQLIAANSQAELLIKNFQTIVELLNQQDRKSDISAQGPTPLPQFIEIEKAEDDVLRFGEILNRVLNPDLDENTRKPFSELQADINSAYRNYVTALRDRYEITKKYTDLTNEEQRSQLLAFFLAFRRDIDQAYYAREEAHQNLLKVELGEEKRNQDEIVGFAADAFKQRINLGRRYVEQQRQLSGIELQDETDAAQRAFQAALGGSDIGEILRTQDQLVKALAAQQHNELIRFENTEVDKARIRKRYTDDARQTVSDGARAITDIEQRQADDLEEFRRQAFEDYVEWVNRSANEFEQREKEKTRIAREQEQLRISNIEDAADLAVAIAAQTADKQQVIAAAQIRQAAIDARQLAETRAAGGAPDLIRAAELQAEAATFANETDRQSKLDRIDDDNRRRLQRQLDEFIKGRTAEENALSSSLNRQAQQWRRYTRQALGFAEDLLTGRIQNLGQFFLDFIATGVKIVAQAAIDAEIQKRIDDALTEHKLRNFDRIIAKAQELQGSSGLALEVPNAPQGGLGNILSLASLFGFNIPGGNSLLSLIFGSSFHNPANDLLARGLGANLANQIVRDPVGFAQESTSDLLNEIRTGASQNIPVTASGPSSPAMPVINVFAQFDDGRIERLTATQEYRRDPSVGFG